jgi:hypothetical protein
MFKPFSRLFFGSFEMIPGRWCGPTHNQQAVNASAHFCGQAVFQFPGDGERSLYDRYLGTPIFRLAHMSWFEKEYFYILTSHPFYETF